MQSKSFSYSRKLGTARANKLQIMLPVTDGGTPDYEFMERFGRKMMSNKYSQYLAFLSMSDTMELKQLRRKRNLTQKKFADRIGTAANVPTNYKNMTKERR